MEKKKILFQFTNGFGFELIPADTEEDAWVELAKKIEKAFKKAKTARRSLKGKKTISLMNVSGE